MAAPKHANKGVEMIKYKGHPTYFPPSTPLMKFHRVANKVVP